MMMRPFLHKRELLGMLYVLAADRAIFCSVQGFSSPLPTGASLMSRPSSSYSNRQCPDAPTRSTILCWTQLFMDNNDNDDPSMITIDSSDDDDGDGDISKRESGGIDLVANQVVSEEMDDDDDVDVSVDDPYLSVAASEFTASHIKLDNNPTTTTTTSDLVRRSGEFPNDEDDLSITTMDWGGALGKLRQRLDDMEQGKSGNPSQALFRLMSSQSPNQAIGSFVTSANPHVVQAMSGAVSSLLGGLSSPTSGVETLVKATGEKLGSLCFQLQMTGYMFRNVEYVIALKDLMKLRGSATLQDYKDAFDRLDVDKSGFIESTEVAQLLNDVYEGNTPAFEVQTFIKFFDKNNDGKISWEEFELGLGAALAAQSSSPTPLASSKSLSLAPHIDDEDDEDEDDEPAELSEPEVSGTVHIALKKGKVVEVDAKEYIQNLKDEALALKDAINREKPDRPSTSDLGDSLTRRRSSSAIDEFGGIAHYIAGLQGDVRALTQGISPEIVETMKLLINYVLEGGESGKGKNVPKEKLEMEIPGSALQQLALWQLILGYRLREAEAKGDYLKLLK